MKNNKRKTERIKYITTSSPFEIIQYNDYIIIMGMLKYEEFRMHFLNIDYNSLLNFGFNYSLKPFKIQRTSAKIGPQQKYYLL